MALVQPPFYYLLEFRVLYWNSLSHFNTTLFLKRDFLFLFKTLQLRRALQLGVVKKESHTDSFLSQTLCVIAHRVWCKQYAIITQRFFTDILSQLFVISQIFESRVFRLERMFFIVGIPIINLETIILISQNKVANNRINSNFTKSNFIVRITFRIACPP